MPQHPTQAIRGPRFSAAQREALDAIGDALKQRRIDFAMATELSDSVKAGRIDAVLEALDISRPPDTHLD